MKQYSSGNFNFRIYKILLAIMEHYHDERPHQGSVNNIIEFDPQATSNQGLTQVREGLGGLLKYYYREPRDPEITEAA